MPGDKKHHTEKFRSCVEKVMAQGKDEDSAYAICTVSLQEAGESIFEAMEEMRHLHLRGATGKVRVEMHEGREHLVVPVVALMEGVIHAVNAETPEFVPLATLAKAASSWNGRPVTLGHPTRNGRQCSANSPELLISHGIGTIFNSRVEGKKLLCEAWIDKAKAERLDSKMLARLLENKSEEVSVGAHVVTDGVSGMHLGKAFKASWRDTAGDHLAFLPGGRGACSIEMGCGAHRAATMRVLEDGLEIVEPTIRERLSGFFEDFRAAIGARNSAGDLRTIQSMHDGAVALGAECGPWALGDRTAAAKKYKDCVACGGTGSLDGNPCEACDGDGKFKAACGCEHTEAEMNRTERIAALLKNEHNPLKDEKGLTASDDTALANLETHCKTAATLKAAADKTAEEKKAAEEKEAEDKKKAAEALKSAQDKTKSIEERLTAAEASLKVAQANQVTDEIRALVDDKKKSDAEKQALLVASLKTAQSVYSEERLAAMPIAQLEEIAALAKVEAPVSYAGRGIPASRAASAQDYTPPDPYEAGIKALQSKAVN